MKQQYGQLSLIFGPMFSGKSSELQRIVRRYEISKKRCLMVNYAEDCRYSSEEVVSTHDRYKTLIPRIMKKASKVHSLAELDSQIDNFDVVAIDEGQFFLDVIQFLPRSSISLRIGRIRER